MGLQQLVLAIGALIGGSYVAVWMLFLQITTPSSTCASCLVNSRAVTTRPPAARPPYVYTTWKQDRPSKLDEVPLVVLTSYMHAGSSILGSVFMKHPRGVYLYEPLDAIYVSVVNTIRYLWPTAYTNNPDTSFRQRTPSEMEMIGHYIEAMLKCHISELPELFTEHMYIGGDTNCILRCPATQDSLDKAYGFHPREMLSNGTIRHKPCTNVTAIPAYCHISKLTYACLNSDLIALKVLKYDVGDLETRLRLHPNLYVLHELRDPRGIVQSLINEDYDEMRIQLHSREICNLMSHDLLILEELAQHYVNRIKIIRYEDFAEAPIDITLQIYNFIKAKLPSEVVRWLHDMTNSEVDSGKYERRNASLTANKWRWKMSAKNKAMVAKECQHLWPLLQPFGYHLHEPDKHAIHRQTLENS